MNIIDLEDFLADLNLISEYGQIQSSKPKTRYLEYHEKPVSSPEWWVQLEVSAGRFLDRLLAFSVDDQKRIIEGLQEELARTNKGRLLLVDMVDSDNQVYRSAVQVNLFHEGVPGKTPDIVQIIPA